MNVQKTSLAAEAAAADIALEVGNGGSVLCGFAVADAGISCGRGGGVGHDDGYLREYLGVLMRGRGVEGDVTKKSLASRKGKVDITPQYSRVRRHKIQG